MVTERPLLERTQSRDWTNQTNAILNEAKASRNTSKNLRGSAVATRKAVEKQTKEKQATVDEALRRKVADTTCLKNKLEKRMASLQAEIDKITSIRDKGEHMANSLIKPMKKTENRVHMREKRPQREKLFDKVDRALAHELDELKKAHATLDDLVKTATEHIQIMISCRQNMKLDHHDKTHSLKLDMECLDLPSRPPTTPNPNETNLFTVAAGKGRLDKGAAPQKSTTLPNLWRQNTERAVNDACRLEHESCDLRKKIVNTMHQIEEIKYVTHSQVQDALGSKVKLTALLQSKLSQNLLDVNTELENLKDQRATITRTLQAKEIPLRIVKDRLAIRRTRPARETVRDSVEEALEDELGRLTDAIQKLNHKLQCIDAEHDRLIQAQRTIGQDIKDKNSSLNIDKRCLEIDQSSSQCTLASGRSTGSIKTPRQVCILLVM